MAVFHRRRAAIAAVTVLVVCVTGGAIAWWAGPGAGASDGTIAAPAPLILTPGAPTTALYPGRSGDVALSIQNTNAFPLFVPSLALDTSQGPGGYGVDSDHAAAGCTSSALAYTTQDNGAAGWTIAANSTLDLDLAGAVDLDTASESACQGATYTVYLKAAP